MYFTPLSGATPRPSGFTLRKIPTGTVEEAAEWAERLTHCLPRVAPPENPKLRPQAYRRCAAARRRDAIRLRTMPWTDTAAIAEVYAESSRFSADTGVRPHVDHVYPLRGQLVSGLHVEANLRIISAAENLQKGNRVEGLDD